MKLKRNSPTTLLVVSFLLMALSGCGQQAEPDSAQPPLETVTYSNLTDADSRKLLTEALADANVDENPNEAAAGPRGSVQCQRQERMADRRV